ncbi:MAG: hypothetical protein QOG68_262 [Solirubrobacteraceae bacterium]|nr:hypothetical protein [Solirubrobacteraceae bacterium]
MRPSRLVALAILACLPFAATPAPAATLGERAYRAGIDAYLYGYPPLLSRLTADNVPGQTLVNIAALTDPGNRVIVAPNVDTPYSVANLDLAAEPLVLHVPAITGRYYVFELLDAYTNVIGYVGSRTTGTAAGDYALTGPGFTGTVPAGVSRIKSPTNRIVVVGRTLALGPGDLPNVRAIQQQYGLTPLSAVAAGESPRPGVILDSSQGLTTPVLPTGLAFFDAVGALLADQPPPARDARLLARLRAFGIGPGLSPSTADLDPAVKSGLERAAAAGPARVEGLVAALRRRSAGANQGWVLETRGVGRYGTDYGLRALIASQGLWANTAEEALYPTADQDASGRRLDGRRRYAVHFAKGRLPPARAFWSLTMYDGALHLYANELDRYALGDRSSGMRRDRDGGLTIYLQHARPAAARVGNRLPAPAGRFTVALRLYSPAQRALSGRWKPPGIVRAG